MYTGGVKNLRIYDTSGRICWDSEWYILWEYKHPRGEDKRYRGLFKDPIDRGYKENVTQYDECMKSDSILFDMAERRWCLNGLFQPFPILYVACIVAYSGIEYVV